MLRVRETMGLVRSIPLWVVPLPLLAIVMLTAGAGSNPSVPASVTRYASQLRGLPWSCSAHAKDIWTSADWDLAGKLSSARWTVTCTKPGFDRLKALANGNSRVHLS